MRCAVALQVPDQVPLVERSHLCASVRHGCDGGIDVGDVIGVCRGWRGRRYRRVRQRGGGRDARDARA